jgi:very-long-chain enoyl-CoA reductase
MVKVTVSTTGKPSGLTRNLPITLDLADRTAETATVEDVKKAVAAQFPKVGTRFLG